VSRYRLRFLLQEIDLPQGETLIGRSASCHVTIEDPLVSRQHARIVIEGNRVTAEDLGSRNGLLVNGRPARGRVDLQDGDRVRIGTQELVFCAVRAASRPGTTSGTRPTGFMCHCAACGLPYPMEAPLCPSCGSRERMDEDTVSGVVSDTNRNWTLELLVEVLQRAASLERWDDAERVLRRSLANIEERVHGGQVVAREHLDQLAEAAARLAEVRQSAEWGRWLLGIYAALGMVPHPSITDRLSTLPPAERASLAPAAHRIVQSVNARGGPSEEDRAAFSRVESLTAPGTGGSG
jgi:hypothetical protein